MAAGRTASAWSYGWQCADAPPRCAHPPAPRWQGLSLTLFLAVPVLYSLLVLSRTDASAAAAGARSHA